MGTTTLFDEKAGIELEIGISKPDVILRSRNKKTGEEQSPELVLPFELGSKLLSATLQYLADSIGSNVPGTLSPLQRGIQTLMSVSNAAAERSGCWQNEGADARELGFAKGFIDEAMTPDPTGKDVFDLAYAVVHICNVAQQRGYRLDAALNELCKSMENRISILSP